VVQKRKVFYIEGYDPQGAAGYYALFRREFARFLKLWPVRGKLTALEADPGAHAGHWNIETEAPDWKVSTAYEFLNWDDIIAQDLARSMPSRVVRTLARFVDDLRTGLTFRIYRASWRFGFFFHYPMAALTLWLAASIGAGWIVARTAAALVVAPVALSVLVGVATTLLVFRLLQPLAKRWFVIQLADLWLFFRDLIFDRRRDFERRVDRFAERLVAAARAATDDEIVVVGHSGGAVVASLVVARALMIDPQLGKRGPRLVLLTLGSIMPAVALHPRAGRLRDELRRLACEASLLWVDCQTRRDLLNFFDFDPIGGIGIDAGPQRCNPVVLKVHFRDALSPDVYRRFRWNFFRLHFQFIMANDLRAHYDYFLYLCSPLPLGLWARRPAQALASFRADASLDRSLFDQDVSEMPSATN
jgi:hypothetical protein